ETWGQTERSPFFSYPMRILDLSLPEIPSSLAGSAKGRRAEKVLVRSTAGWAGFHHLITKIGERSVCPQVLHSFSITTRVIFMERNVVRMSDPLWLLREPKRVEKLRYIHNNPVNRGLVISPEEWEWSSSRHYATGEESVVEIESWWTATRREALGVHPTTGYPIHSRSVRMSGNTHRWY